MVLTQSLADAPIAKKKRLEVIEQVWEQAPPTLSAWSDSSINKLTQMYWHRLKTTLIQGLSEPS